MLRMCSYGAMQQHELNQSLECLYRKNICTSCSIFKKTALHSIDSKTTPSALCSICKMPRCIFKRIDTLTLHVYRSQHIFDILYLYSRDHMSRYYMGSPGIHTHLPDNSAGAPP